MHSALYAFGANGLRGKFRGCTVRVRQPLKVYPQQTQLQTLGDKPAQPSRKLALVGKKGVQHADGQPTFENMPGTQIDDQNGLDPEDQRLRALAEQPVLGPLNAGVDGAGLLVLPEIEPRPFLGVNTHRRHRAHRFKKAGIRPRLVVDLVHRDARKRRRLGEPHE